MSKERRLRALLKGHIKPMCAYKGCKKPFVVVRIDKNYNRYHLCQEHDALLFPERQGK
jgi:hypothetical protein